MASEKNNLLIIDGNAIVHRAYHALPPLANKKGEETGAIYGFLLAFFKAIKDFSPDYVAACFDFPAPTFRKEISKDYKATRAKADPELYAQIPGVKAVLNSFGVSVFEKQGFEADDLIGTISCSVQSDGSEFPVRSVILSGDCDVLQLVNGLTSACMLRRGVKDTLIFDEKLVFEKYGITPGQLVDYKALRGDPTDNIPGVKGIGPKTALDLLSYFQTLDLLYQKIEQDDKGEGKLSRKLAELLLNQKEQCLTSRKLARIKTDVPIDFNLDLCRWSNYDGEKAKKALEDLGFFSLVKRLPGSGAEDVENAPRPVFKKNLKLW